MTRESKAPGMSGRALALARRRALSGAGKAALQPSAPSRSRQGASGGTSVPPPARAAAAAPGAIPPARPRASVRAPAAGIAATSSSRAAALARRQAMSSRGKVAAGNKDRVRNGLRNKPVAEAAPAGEDIRKDSGCSCGCNGSGARSETLSARPAASSRANGRTRVRGPRRNEAMMNPGRAASLARRQAQSARGKAGMNASGMTPAQTARAANPGLSGRELAKALREQRSRRGGAGQKRSAPSGRSRAARTAPVSTQGAAKDASWKVGAGETARGQTVTGTMVGRSRDVTGDEASTCRAVTGTEYMGADIFRDFCQSEPTQTPIRGGVSPTTGGNPVTGSEVGRSIKVTGDEPGTCQAVTGTEYMGANLQEAFCGIKPEPGPAKVASVETRAGKRVTGSSVARSPKVTGGEVGAGRTLTGTQYMQLGEPGAAPPKVGVSSTLSGGAVTGTMVGRHKSMTGDEAGSCRNVTGDDYVGQEQYAEPCAGVPTRKERKVGVSATLGGERVTGTMTGRAARVTGDEPGTCKAITGTPYAGVEQYGSFCEPTEINAAAARMQRSKRMFGSVMTGIQPSVGGAMTGDGKGVCEPVTGTPYVGLDQAAAACPSMPAEPGSPDFPQPLPEAAGAQPLGTFSISPPAQAAEAPQPISGVTGSTYEGGQITGPFGMAPGKVTGTEEARFGRGRRDPVEAEVPPEASMIHGRVKSRITGEGMDAGAKITGDDWARGDRVTGTEGTSALVRNQSRRGPMMAMAAAMATSKAQGRPESVPEPVSKVTGGSGNSEKGALITYSGGARG